MLRATSETKSRLRVSAAHVVTGLVERVERVGELDRAVLALAHEEVLELGADHELVADGAGAVELAAQDRARAVGPLLALDVHVAGEARDVRAPRQRRERARGRASRRGRGRAAAGRSSPAAKPGEARRRPPAGRRAGVAGTSFAFGLPCMSTNCANRNSTSLSSMYLRDVVARSSGGVNGLSLIGSGNAIPQTRDRAMWEVAHTQHPELCAATTWVFTSAVPTLGLHVRNRRPLLEVARRRATRSARTSARCCSSSATAGPTAPAWPSTATRAVRLQQGLAASAPTGYDWDGVQRRARRASSAPASRSCAAATR